jgi:formate dehydrogenase major subunit
VVEFEPPIDVLDENYPIRLTTGRRLDSYNTGVQTAGYRSPLRQQEALEIAPEDGAKYGVADGERVRISSRRGSVEACVQYGSSLRPGLAFLSYNHPDEVPTNFLTNDAVDSKSGTAEYKAAAIRIEKLPALEVASR